MSYGFDIRKGPIEIRPRPHYHCGGVVTNEKSETKVTGLFAAGAVTAGVHGANRLGSNALVDILVFGDIAGKNAADTARNSNNGQRDFASQIDHELRQIEDLVSRTPNKPIMIPPLRRRHYEMMDKYVGVLRIDEGLKIMLKEIDRTRKEELPHLMIKDKSRRYNFELRDALEVPFRLTVQELATRAAEMRKESRGAHFRDDYPKRNDKLWLKNIVFFKKDDAIVSEVTDIDMAVMKIEELTDYAASDSPWH